MPRADDLPSFKVDTRETPCTHNPLGVKGCGEAGAIGAPAALMNAISDALGVKDIAMPATPSASGGAASQESSLRRTTMYAFDYHRPASVADAAATLPARATRKLPRRRPEPAAGDEAAPRLALATSSTSAASPTCAASRSTATSVTIGAMTRTPRSPHSADVQQAIPALAALAGSIGDRQVRNMGTLGGSIANNDPAADYPAAVLALGATINTDKRKIAADDFFNGLFETALSPAR